MTWHDRIKNFYNKKLWTKEMVYNAVVKGKITEEEYADIVGEK